MADLPPDMISSVISRPPWFGSLILIYQDRVNIGQVSTKHVDNIIISTVCNDPVTADLQLPPNIINTIVIFR